MTSLEIKNMDAEYLLPTYARFDLCLQSGKGCRAVSPEGKSYLDFTSGIGVNSLGWADDEWLAAITHQAGTLQHTSNLFYTQPSTTLAKALCQRTGMARVFFGNSGAEANEGAIKAARKYSHQTHSQGRSTILTLKNSFHGRTLATLTATGQEAMHQHFHPFLPGFKYLAAGNLQALEKALTNDVCAVLFEPIQGEGGVVPLEDSFVTGLAALCREKDVLLIADEVQTGVGRTGTFLACQHVGVQPDIITLAKGLGAGLPIGAVLLNEKTAAVMQRGDHGSTFGANPVCCAGAGVVMNRLTDDFLADVTAKGEQLAGGLTSLAGVHSVTGRGLMLGVQFAEGIAAADVQKAAMEKGLLCLLAKDKLRLLPPLTVTSPEIYEGLTILKNTLEGLG